MHIYLDESGNFSGVGSGVTALSTQGALILASHKLPKLFDRYAKLRHQLPKRNGEVKGSLLNEHQVASVIDLLRRNEAIFCASIIDMGEHSSEEIEAHRAIGVASLSANLTDGHTAELHAGVADLQARMSAFSIPLYAQFRVTLELLHRVLQEMIIYHCQRNPKELAEFHWVVDGKSPGPITNWEDWWSNTVVIWLQAMSLAKPGDLLPGGDYRHFERFFLHALPAYLDGAVEVDPTRPVGVDLQLMFRESFRFSSEAEPGLELVDIATNALRRALVGNLGKDGWLPLRTIMIHRSDLYVTPLSLRKVQSTVTDAAYRNVLNHFRQGGRIMATANLEWPD